ncbi:MAG: DeoR/GlpR family DNA-binding transcription regulator [Oligosphaeraceae bacterium]
MNPRSRSASTTEREQQILDLLAGVESLSVGDLSRKLGVSEATMRRDLSSMAGRGLLHRYHGGASLASPTASEQLFSDKENLLSEEKRRIAQAALSLIEDNDRIYLDGGSTTLYLARLLERRHGLTVVTNSLMAASLLMESGHHLVLVGGEFRALSRTLVGPLTAPILKNLSFDKAFMGTLGFTLAQGLSTSDPAEAFTKRLVMRRAGQVILLLDHSKLGTNSFISAGGVQDVDTLVTDAISETFRSKLEEFGTKVIIA